MNAGSVEPIQELVWNQIHNTANYKELLKMAGELLLSTTATLAHNWCGALLIVSWLLDGANCFHNQILKILAMLQGNDHLLKRCNRPVFVFSLVTH